jgi:hypothetical protein
MPIIINIIVVNADWKEVWCKAVKRNLYHYLISHRYKILVKKLKTKPE